MTTEEFLSYIELEMGEALKLLKIKNADYADSDPFKNFRNSIIAGVSVEQGIIVRILDKVTRISNLLSREAQVKTESIEDSARDIANYSLILLAYLKSKHE